jgi:hypothetical protein
MFDSAMYLKGGAMATSIGTAKQQALLQACFYQRFTSESASSQHPSAATASSSSIFYPVHLM